jgi:hypothetical protein
MTTKSRERIYGAAIRASAERARQARKEADRLACAAWNQRMLGYTGPAQPSRLLRLAMPATAILWFAASAATRTKRSPSTSYVVARRRRTAAWRITSEV